MTREVQSICCINDAGFDMKFWIEWVNPSDGSTIGWTQTNSGVYPVDQRRTLDVASVKEVTERLREQ